MNPYAVQLQEKEGFQVYVLSDSGSHSIVEIMPEVGNNLYRFDSRGRQVIMPPASLNALKHEPMAHFKYGTPILSPPNRVKNGSFAFHGRTYCLPINEPPDHHLHGQISSRAWEVVEAGASEEAGAFVTSRFRYEAHPDILAYFPHELIFTVTYRLLEGQLHYHGTITNAGKDEAPFAFGLHPYFVVPYDTGEGISLTVPAKGEWPVTNQAFVTGKPSVTPFSTGMNDGVEIADYAPLRCSLIALCDGDRTCRIEMKERGYAIAYRIDEGFPFVVLFRPDWSSSYSIEPYTYVTDAFNLPYEHELTGARGIGAGETIQLSTSIRIESV